MVEYLQLDDVSIFLGRRWSAIKKFIKGDEMVTEVDRAVGRVNRITSSGVTIDSRCTACHGSGLETLTLNVVELVDIYKKFPDNKIQRIKEARAIWSISLKPAKELIEAYDRLLKELTEINYS